MVLDEPLESDDDVLLESEEDDEPAVDALDVDEEPPRESVL